MVDEPPKEELTGKEMEKLDKILDKLLSVKKYLYFIIIIKFL
jgi:hypothetical protein